MELPVPGRSRLNFEKGRLLVRFKGQVIKNVAVFELSGNILGGRGSTALREEIEKHTRLGTGNIVLDMAKVSSISAEGQKLLIGRYRWRPDQSGAADPATLTLENPGFYDSGIELRNVAGSHLDAIEQFIEESSFTDRWLTVENLCPDEY